VDSGRWDGVRQRLLVQQARRNGSVNCRRSPRTAKLFDFSNERDSPLPIKRKDQNYGKST
jgi:hypothetical protein